MLTETNAKRLKKWEELEVATQLSALPFNTSLAGYSMLIEAILISLRLNKFSVNMSSDVYVEIAKSRNISVNSVEKAIKNAIDSVNYSAISMKDFVIPNMLIKNALLDGKPKHFITAICQVIRHIKIKQDLI